MTDLLALELALEEHQDRLEQLLSKVGSPDLTDVVNAVQGLKGPASAEEIAQAIRKVLQVPQPVDMSDTLAEVTSVLEKLEFRLQGQGPAFGASGPSNISDNTTRKLGIVQSITEPVEIATALATESTLDAIRDYFLATRSTQYATASVPTSTWTTVLTYTAAVNQHILGFNAERTGGLTNITYRYRLRIDGVVVLEEGVNVSANSWVPIETGINAGQVATVQAFHSEVTSQDFNASLNVRNLV